MRGNRVIAMSLTERILVELRTQPPGVPIAAQTLAERLQSSLKEVLAAGDEMRQREQGDEELVSVVGSSALTATASSTCRMYR